MKARLLWHGLITLALLAVANGLIWQKERLLAHGTTVLLHLAPVDPRSLMQGDYMALRYEMVTRAPVTTFPSRGRFVIRREPTGVASFVRVDDGKRLAADEMLLKFHHGGADRASLGAESFFFEEGKADQFTMAKYGELKVASDGSSVLVGLRDEALQPLPRPLPAAARPGAGR